MRAVAPVVDVWDSPERKERLTQLVQSEPVEEIQRSGDWVQVVCVQQPQKRANEWGGYLGWVQAHQLDVLDRTALIEWVEEWLGTPYVWGGLSRAGIDCSGLIHLAYRIQGRQIPRDACDQHECATPLPLTELEPGDLLFSDTEGKIDHVMLFTGGDELLEASKSAGLVRRYSVKKRIEETALLGGRISP